MMKKDGDKLRKEVWLAPAINEKLARAARKNKVKQKRHMENVLEESVTKNKNNDTT